MTLAIRRRLFALTIALTACNGCSNEPTKYYEAGRPDGNTGGEGGLEGGGEGGSDAAVGPVCAPTMTFGAAMSVSGVAAGDKMFGAVTPDELTIAWVTPSGGVMYADRSAASQPFGAAQALAGTFEHDRVALTGDGLTLIVVMTGAKTFGQVTRSMRTQPFSGAPDTAPFSMLLLPFMSEMDGGPGAGNLGDPVVSADGKQMFFSIYNQGNRDTVAFSEKSATNWGKPVVLNQAELGSSGNQRRRPTGLSSDGRTLFFWDEIDVKEKAGWRGSAMAFDLALSGIVDLGDKKDAQPTATCTRLYFTNPPAAPSDVKLADKN